MKNNNLLALGVLVKRNIKLYLKDKMTVFFSLLAPIIILALYLLFLGDLQVDTIMNTLKDYDLENVLTHQDIGAVVNNWMVAGLMGTSCITVAINTNMVMMKDKANGNINDMLSSPIKRWVVYLSYIITCFIITFVICFIVLLLAIVYLAATGGLMMSFVDFLAIVGVMILSILSSAAFMILICGFLKTPASLGALNGVISTAIGFLIGAYMPFSMLPDPIEYVGCFIPGSYSVGLFKEYFLKGCIGKLKLKIPPGNNVMSVLTKEFSLELDFFGMRVSTGWMVLALVISLVLFAGLIAIFYSNKKTNFFMAHKKKAKRRK